MSHAESAAHYASGTQQRHLCDPEHWDPDGECVNNPTVGGVPLGYGGANWSLVGSGGVNPIITLPHPSINITTGATITSPLNLQLTHHWKWVHVQPGPPPHPVYFHLQQKGWTQHKIQELVLPSSQHHTSIGNIYLNDLVHSGQGVLGAPNYVAPLQNPAFLYNQYQGWVGPAANPQVGGCNWFNGRLGNWESNLHQAVSNTPQATQEVINFWQSKVNWVKCMMDKCCCTGCPTFTFTQTAKLGTQGDALSTHPKWDASLGEYLENEFEI